MKQPHTTKIHTPDKINKERFPSGFSTKRIYKDPHIIKIKHLLTNSEIRTVLDMAKDKFERSTIIVDDEMIESSTRTSQTAFITDNGQKEKYSPEIDSILKKICYLVGCNRNQIESLMVVKYGPGEEYYNHHDYFEPEFKESLEDGGQRIATFFLYLNSLDRGDGGETEFPKIGVKSVPRKGGGVFWWNVDVDCKVKPKTLHRGNPVKRGVKYGMNVWIREVGW